MNAAESAIAQLQHPSNTWQDRSSIERVIGKMPEPILEKLAQNGTQIRVLQRGQLYAEASPELKRLSIDVDAWPAPPAGLFVVSERTLYLRSLSPMTIVHELGHAYDCALGGGAYVSGLDPVLRQQYIDATSFTSPYAATGLDEWFAEGFRCYVSQFVEANDRGSHWPKASIERLEACAPRLMTYLGETLERRVEGRAMSALTLDMPDERVSMIDATETAGTREKPAREKRDLRAEITQRILDELEQGKIPWSKPWASVAPFNGASNRPYHGGNRLWLRIVAQDRGYSDPRWMTFNQAREKGWMVAKGEHGIRVEYWKPPEDRSRAEEDAPAQPGDPASNEEKRSRGWRVFSATVFNAHQVLAPVLDGEGQPVMETGENGEMKAVMKPLAEVQPYNRKRIDFTPVERVQRFLDRYEVEIRHGGDEAYYMPSSDRIQLPPPTSFNSADDYYSTALHEVSHSTGHATRLNREGVTSGAPFGSEVYAKEELRAELASVFLSDEYGISLGEYHFRNHAAYIQNWIKVLKENKHELFAASRDAEAITEYVIERERVLVPELEQERSVDRDAVALSAEPTRGEREPFHIVRFDGGATAVVRDFEVVDTQDDWGHIDGMKYVGSGIVMPDKSRIESGHEIAAIVSSHPTLGTAQKALEERDREIAGREPSAEQLAETREYLDQHFGMRVTLRQEARGSMGLGAYTLLQGVEDGVVQAHSMGDVVDDATFAAMQKMVNEHNREREKILERPALSAALRDAVWELRESEARGHDREQMLQSFGEQLREMSVGRASMADTSVSIGFEAAVKTELTRYGSAQAVPTERVVALADAAERIADELRERGGDAPFLVSVTPRERESMEASLRAHSVVDGMWPDRSATDGVVLSNYIHNGLALSERAFPRERGIDAQPKGKYIGEVLDVSEDAVFHRLDSGEIVRHPTSLFDARQMNTMENARVAVSYWPDGKRADVIELPAREYGLETPGLEITD